MPNWCANNVVFTGDKAKIKNIAKLMYRLIKKQGKVLRGYMPSFCQFDSGYMFGISWESGSLYYLTKWGPNTLVIMAIAKQYGVEFTHDYDEPGMMIYGRYIYKDGGLTDYCLEEEDYAQFDEHPEKESTWIFEGNEYDNYEEILETLLERKIKSANEMVDELPF